MYKAKGTHIAYTSDIWNADLRAFQTPAPRNIYNPPRQKRYLDDHYVEEARLPIQRVDKLPEKSIVNESVLVQNPDGSYSSQIEQVLKSNQPDDRLLLLNRPPEYSMSQRMKKYTDPRLKIDLSTASKNDLANYLYDNKVLPDYTSAMTEYSKDHLFNIANEFQSRAREGEKKPSVAKETGRNYVELRLKSKKKRLEDINHLGDMIEFINENPADAMAPSLAFYAFFDDSSPQLSRNDMLRSLNKLREIKQNKKLATTDTIKISVGKTGASESLKSGFRLK